MPQGFAFSRRVAGDWENSRPSVQRNQRELETWLNAYTIRADVDAVTLDLTSYTTSVAAPTSANHAATKDYVDSLAYHDLSHSIYAAYGPASALTVDNTEKAIDFSTEVERDTANYSESSGTITITNAGLYEVLAVVSIESVDDTGGIRGAPRLIVRYDPNTGTFAAQPPFARGYLREDATEALSENLVFIRPINVVASGKIEVRITDNVATEPNEQVPVNGASVFIRRIS